jgi:hypothetical protein
MTSRDLTPIELDGSVSPASAAASGPSLHNAFSQMIDLNRATPTFTTRDRCMRPTPTYNFNYNPYKPPSDTQPARYSPYVFNEPLFDDRPAVVANLPRNHVLAPAPKKPRTQWV